MSVIRPSRARAVSWALLTLALALGSLVWMLWAGHRFGGHQGAPALFLAVLLVLCIGRTAHHLRALAEHRKGEQ